MKHFLKLWYGVRCIPCLLLFCISACCGQGSSVDALSVTDLKCRNLVNPEGIDFAAMSWKIDTKAQNVTQSAWEIEIASSEKALRRGKADLWCSQPQTSDRQFDIRPEGVTFTPGVKYWWRVRVWDEQQRASAWSDPAFFSIGLSNEQWQAQWITSTWSDQSPMPYFRKCFDTEKRKVARAVVYLSGLGCSDLFINGARVDSTRILDPAQTNYEQYALYSTFDVTESLQRGANCIGVMLGDGWYDQGVVWGKGFSYGDPLFRLQMEVTYKDGSTQTVISDTTWQWTEGPILRANLYAGEVFDATKQIPQWADAHTDASSWKHAQVAQGIIPQELRPQLIEPIRMQQEIAPVSLWKDSAGNWIYDFGVNVAAIPCLTVEQPSGTRIKMRMGENLNPNRTIDFSTTGPGATGVIQTDEYICAGTGRESWTPRFTYHGFRYLELSGAATEPQLSWLKAITVYTDVQPRGSFECANPQINRLHEMAVRTMLSNIHGLPTDCPHRERCGWLGDAHAVAPFENCNFNMENFWLKYLEDIHSSSSVFLENTLHQKLYNSEFYFADKQPGIPFMISPGRRLCGVASPDWGTAVVQLPWYVYLYYGSTEALERYYPEMKQWVDHIEALTENHIVPYGLGDWCPPDGNAAIDCPIPLSSSLFHYLDASLLSQSAKALGKTEDANHYAVLAEQIGHAICKKFYDPQKKSFGSQTANAMALSFGVVPAGDEEAVSAAIVENMALYHDFIHTGIFGLGHIGQALSRYGHAAEAWRVFTKTGEHSFAWMWENPISEATTLWETLPVSNSSAAVGLKASLNHPMEAVFDTWFYEDILGIRPDASAPGFKVVRLDPTLTASLPWAKGSIETPYGKVSSSWKQTDGRLEWEIQIPANTSGLVALPVGKTITIDGAAWDEGLFPVVLQRPDANLCRFPSGDYVITAR